MDRTSVKTGSIRGEHVKARRSFDVVVQAVEQELRSGATSPAVSSSARHLKN
jgi:hypothetical protein